MFWSSMDHSTRRGLLIYIKWFLKMRILACGFFQSGATLSELWDLDVAKIRTVSKPPCMFRLHLPPLKIIITL